MLEVLASLAGADEAAGRGIGSEAVSTGVRAALLVAAGAAALGALIGALGGSKRAPAGVRVAAAAAADGG
jgi:hypothetical protein